MKTIFTKCGSSYYAITGKDYVQVQTFSDGTTSAGIWKNVVDVQPLEEHEQISSEEFLEKLGDALFDLNVVKMGLSLVEENSI